MPRHLFLRFSLRMLFLLLGLSAIGFSWYGEQYRNTPQAVVERMLKAVQQGNEGLAERCLSESAIKRTAQAGLAVAPPGSSDAKFSLGDVSYQDGIALVPCEWTAPDAQGQTRTDSIVWRLRQGPQGWRIIGMQAEIFPGQPALVLDFENPEEILRIQQNIESLLENPSP